MPNYTVGTSSAAGRCRDEGTEAMATRGRPKLRGDDELLADVVRAFANHGYEAVSMRQLSVSLGLSHSALGQRFGTKDQLYRRAVDAEFDRFLAELARSRASRLDQDTDLAELRASIESFLETSARFPALGQLMNQEGAEPSARLDYIIETVVRPQLSLIAALLDRLIEREVIRPITTRALFFLVAHGAEAPFTLVALSAAFDHHDGPLDVAQHVSLTTDFIMRALIAEPQPPRLDLVPAPSSRLAEERS